MDKLQPNYERGSHDRDRAATPMRELMRLLAREVVRRLQRQQGPRRPGDTARQRDSKAPEPDGRDAADGIGV
jgi:hypothetical protein